MITTFVIIVLTNSILCFNFNDLKLKELLLNRTEQPLVDLFLSGSNVSLKLKLIFRMVILIALK